GHQVGVVVEHGFEDLPLATLDLGIGQCPQHGQAGRGAHQVQAQPPKEAGVGGAVAVPGPSGQLRALDGGARHGAGQRSGVDDPVVVEPQVGVVAQGANSFADQGIGRAQVFVVSGLVGQVGKVGAQVAHGVADPAVLGGEAEQGLGDGQG